MSGKENVEPVQAQDTLFGGGSLLQKGPTVPISSVPADDDLFGGGSRLVSDVSTATLSSGKKLVLKTRFKQKNDNDSNGERNYYGVDIHKILAKVESEKEQTSTTKQSNYQHISSGSLLSEKYRPRIWTDLVGSEKQHRFMLKWLVSWSHVVFGTEIQKHDEKEQWKYDSLGRPRRKILLIHGPPGIGKTTIAHILSKQAGYDTMEINASDERNAAAPASMDGGETNKRINVIKGRIATALASHRMGSKGKPVCVVADEIDGAAENGLIRALIEIIKADEKALHRHENGDTNEKDSKKRKRSAQASSLLQRPIIAVCNDAFAPALRELRPYCEMVSYTRVPNHMVVTRLKSICGDEKINADTGTLTEVADAMDGDLRSCLNLLQFGMNRDSDGKLITKDTSLNLKSTANRVFRRKGGNVQESHSIIELAHAYGDYEKLLNACFQLYLHKQYYDDLLRKPGILGDWTAFYETLHGAMWRGQNFQLGSYLVHSIAAFYSHCSSSMNVADDKVTNDYEFHEQRRKVSTLIKEFMGLMTPRTRHMIDAPSFSLEIAPYVLKIIDPSNQKVQKSQMEDAAQAMTGLNLRFKKDRLESGTTVYRLDPPYEQIVKFSDEERQKASVGTKFTTRQSIVNILDEPRKRAAAAAAVAASHDTEPSAKKQKVDKKKIQRDFFGREIVVQETSRDGTPIPQETLEEDTKIWVQYVEGFSNAVRKEITWQDLFSF